MGIKRKPWGPSAQRGDRRQGHLSMEVPAHDIHTHVLASHRAATLIAEAAKLGGSTVGDPAVACVAPNTEREWDIGKYDLCVKQGIQAAMRRISLS